MFNILTIFSSLFSWTSLSFSTTFTITVSSITSSSSIKFSSSVISSVSGSVSSTTTSTTSGSSLIKPISWVNGSLAFAKELKLLTKI